MGKGVVVAGPETTSSPQLSDRSINWKWRDCEIKSYLPGWEVPVFPSVGCRFKRRNTYINLTHKSTIYKHVRKKYWSLIGWLPVTWTKKRVLMGCLPSTYLSEIINSWSRSPSKVDRMALTERCPIQRQGYSSSASIWVFRAFVVVENLGWCCWYKRYR